MLMHTRRMRLSVSLSQPLSDVEPAASDPRLDELRATIKRMINWLPADARDDFLRELGVPDRPAAYPKAGDVLATIVHLLPRQKSWTVSELKQQISDRGVEAKPKEIYNALGYLTRNERITRVGYGRYIVDGFEIVTSDDLGGPTTRHEDEYRTVRD